MLDHVVFPSFGACHNECLEGYAPLVILGVIDFRR